MLRLVPAEDRMLFDELSFRKIPIWENRRRGKRSDEFGKLLSKFIDLVGNLCWQTVREFLKLRLKPVGAV